MITLCCWVTSVSSPLLLAVSKPRRHGELSASVDSLVESPKCWGQKVSFLTNEIYDGLGGLNQNFMMGLMHGPKAISKDQGVHYILCLGSILGLIRVAHKQSL